MKKSIYLDYAATTPIDPRVLKAMMPYLEKKYGNTASMHQYGQIVNEALTESRKTVSRSIMAKFSETYFTASATESNNTVVKGVAWANQDKGKHIIISSIEHDCILNSAKWLEKQGWEITQLKVDEKGLIDLDQLKKSIRPDTVLVSIIHASNEVGTIQNITEIGKICRKKNVYFHTDASQSYGKIAIDVNKSNIDLLTASSHKIYGPKGAALLYVRHGVKIEPLLHGGGHENGFRSSTVNVSAIVGFAQAIKIYQQKRKVEAKRLTALRDKLTKGILENIKGSQLNGHPTQRLSNNVNISFDKVEGESILMMLDMEGIAVSTGSACASASLEPSHVLLAMGIPVELAHSSIRFSLGRWTTEQEIERVILVLPKIIKKLRKISPFKN